MLNTQPKNRIRPSVKMVERKAGDASYHRYIVEGDPRIAPIIVDKKKKQVPVELEWHMVAQFLEENPTMQLSPVELPSCSTIAKHADSRGADGLISWALRLYKETGRMRAHRESSDHSIELGNKLHANIHEWIATGEESADQSYLFGSWYSALQEKGAQFSNAEVMVYNADRKLYGGTVDAIGHLDGRPTLFDWKTTDQLDSKGKVKRLQSPQYATQLGGYLSAIRSMKDYFPDIPQPVQAVVVYVFKDTGEVGWEWLDIDKAMEAFDASYSLYTIGKDLYASI